MRPSYWRPARALAIILGAALASGAAAAGEASERAAVAGLFEADSTLALELAAPWRSLLRRRAERPVVPGTLSSAGAGGTRIEIDVEIKPRGNWRLENCAWPPLTLKLEPASLAGTLFAGQPVLHASTVCRDGKKAEQDLFEEYLAYRMYRLWTDVSLRARRVTFDYRDTERGSTHRVEAFLVEDIGLAAERLGLRWIDEERVEGAALEPRATALFALFQYMIGHTDWSVMGGPEGERCCHNTALLAPPGSLAELRPLPYDFDASGFVNTGQIEPSELLDIESVRQRLYRGLCAHNAQLPEALEVARRTRPQIEALVGEGELLTPKARRSALGYLESFYEVIDDPKKLQGRIFSRCRG